MNYRLTVKLIPKRTGLFYIQQGSDINIVEQEFPGYCSLNDMRTVMELNEDQDNHIYLLSSSPDSHFNEVVLANPQASFYDKGGYAFVVIE